MEKVYMDSDLIGRSFICSLLSAIMLSLVSLFISTEFSFFMLTIFSFIFFLFYLFIATPLQIKLNQKPKSFSIVYLFTYILASAVVTALFMLYGQANPFTSVEFYIHVGMSAVIFWVFDSVLLQKKEES
ncbi:UPF0715 family protein [Niallia taxi]|nr:UPF0715 family protein [Niallia taxi]